MVALTDLGVDQCHFPRGDGPAFDFCGAVTDGRTYCPTHDALCHRGHGQPWQTVAAMVAGVEQTIQPAKRRPDRIEAADTVLREAETKMDKPLGLMGRT